MSITCLTHVYLPAPRGDPVLIIYGAVSEMSQDKPFEPDPANTGVGMGQ